MMRLGNGGICTQIGKYSDAMLNNWKKKQCKYYPDINAEKSEKVVRLSRQQN